MKQRSIILTALLIMFVVVEYQKSLFLRQD